ncbi:hypothetical protein BH23BAC1_BH23BAC1_39010 [soil metagenome]
MFILYFLAFFQLNNRNGEVVNNDGLVWNEGMGLLNSKESFKGDLNFNYHTNVVLCRIDNKVKAFPAHQVEGFWFFDQDLEINRFFVTQEFPVKRKLIRKVFLELVLMGEIPVYRRGNFKRHHQKAPAFEDFDYYAFIENDYVQLKDFGKRIYPILIENPKVEIKQFIKDQNIRPYELIDQIRMIGYYNSAFITDDGTTAASKMYNLA